MDFISLASTTWGTSPTIGVSFAYDRRRSGADMQYMLRVSIAPVTGASSFGYPIYLSATLDGAGAVGATTLKAASPSRWTSAITYTSGWITLSNKTSGATAAVFRLYSGSGSYRDTYYSYSLAVDPAGSTLTIPTLTIGEAATIGITRYNAGFTDTITYAIGSVTGTLAEQTSDDEITFTPPTTIYAELPAYVSGNGYFTVSTYNGDTLIQTQQIPFTVNVGADIVPSIDSITVSPVSSGAWVVSSGLYVQNYTRARVQTAATAGAGSTVNTIAITGDTGVGTGADATLDTLTTSGAKTITVTVTDARGRTATDTATITVLAYAPPSITRLDYVRGLYSGGTWTDDPAGAWAKIACSYSMSLATEGNTGALSVTLDGEEIASATVTTGGTFTTYYNIGTDNRYQLAATLTDLVGNTVSYSTLVSTVSVALAFDVFTKSVGMGGVETTPNTVTVFENMAFRTLGTMTANGAAEFNDAASFRGSVSMDTPLPVSSGGVGRTDLADIVIAEGDSGIWHYRKWASGIAECWGTKTGSVSITAAWGGIYEGYVGATSYPFTFLDVPKIYALAYAPTTSLMWIGEIGTPNTTQFPDCYMLRGSSASDVQYGLHMYAVGKWD